MSNLSSSVLEKIKTEKIKPIPRWQFLLKGYVIWVTFIVSLLVGALGFSISLFIVTNNDMFTSQLNGLSVMQTILITVPVFWLLLTAFFMFLAYYNFKHTNGGYRFGVIAILFINLLVSMVLGLGLYVTGISAKLNTIFSDSIPYYNQVADLRSQVWMRPEQGYLSGDILTITDDKKSITIKDLNGKIWTLNLTNALIRPSADISIGSRIKILGQINSNGTFDCTEIRPWNGMMNGSVKGDSTFNHGQNFGR